MKVSRTVWVLLVLIAAGGAAWLALSGRGKPVEVVVVTQGPMVQSVVTSGRIASVGRTELASQNTARIEAILVREGDAVQARQVLVRLRDDEAVANLAQAKAAVTEARGRIRQLNSQSPIEFIRQGEVEPKSLIELGLTSSRASLKTLQFLGEALNDADLADVTGTGRYLGQRSAAHNSAVKTLSLRFTEPFEWLSFSSALELLTTLRGPDLLRLKGIVNVDGEPVVVQGVQHIIDTPVKMDRWPSDDKDSRLVFIVRNMELDVISNLFQAVGAIKSAPLRAT